MLIFVGLIPRSPFEEEEGDRPPRGLDQRLSVNPVPQLLTIARLPSHLELMVMNSLSLAYAQAERFPEAFEILDAARLVADTTRQTRGLAHIRWIEGLIQAQAGEPRRAERAFQAAREGFPQSADRGYIGMIALEQAAATLELGESTRAISFATEALSIVENLALEPKGIAALETLRHAVAQHGVTVPLLRRVGQSLQGEFSLPR